MTWVKGKQIDGKTYVEFDHVKSLMKSKDEEIERLREALRSLACAEGKCGCEVFGIKDVNVGCLHGIARAALEEGKE